MLCVIPQSCLASRLTNSNHLSQDTLQRTANENSFTSITAAASLKHLEVDRFVVAGHGSLLERF